MKGPLKFLFACFLFVFALFFIVVGSSNECLAQQCNVQSNAASASSSASAAQQLQQLSALFALQNQRAAAVAVPQATVAVRPFALPLVAAPTASASSAASTSAVATPQIDLSSLAVLQQLQAVAVPTVAVQSACTSCARPSILGGLRLGNASRSRSVSVSRTR